MITAQFHTFWRLLPIRRDLIFFTLVFFSVLLPASSFAGTITLHQSVEQALNYSPQLQALTHHQQAAQYDLKRARAGYYPSLDLLLGYGVEQYSDKVTRRAGADPGSRDWDNRGDATLSLTQKLYDGGETGDQVSIQKALLDSARFRRQNVAQTVALQAITVHLDVLRQREMVALGEKNLRTHREIYQMLADREKAGAGNIADVTRTQAQLARAQSIVHQSRADLNNAIVNYIRVVGVPPEPQSLAYAVAPDTIPENLEEILTLLEQGNPELSAISAELAEAEKRVDLARTAYKPKIDIQLSSRYNDQLEGDPSWQNTNEAMLNLRWNLFHGGQDKASENVYLSRMFQTRSEREDKLLELRAQASADWEIYQSLQKQKVAFRDAVEYSKKTLDAYLKQFTVSQRSLLDVLSIENDYFQAAGQFVNATIDETLTAYRILAVTGGLRVPKGSDDSKYPEDFNLLKQGPMLSSPKADSVFTPKGKRLPEQEIQKFIDRWVKAWREQDLAEYLNCYSDDFQPEEGKSFEEWRTLRTKALNAPVFIDVSVSHLQIYQESDSLCRVEFNQSYRSDRYRDQVRKKLSLKSQAEGWRIVHEQASPFGS